MFFFCLLSRSLHIIKSYNYLLLLAVMAKNRSYFTSIAPLTVAP